MNIVCCWKNVWFVVSVRFCRQIRRFNHHPIGAELQHLIDWWSKLIPQSPALLSMIFKGLVFVARGEAATKYGEGSITAEPGGFFAVLAASGWHNLPLLLRACSKSLARELCLGVVASHGERYYERNVAAKAKACVPERSAKAPRESLYGVEPFFKTRFWTPLRHSVFRIPWYTPHHIEPGSMI